MSKYFVELEISQTKIGDVSGGSSMRPKKFYFSALARASGQVYECYGGQDKDFFQELCESSLGGQYDESRNPSCLIKRLGITTDFNDRDQKLAQGADPLTSPGAFDTPSGLYLKGPLVSELILPGYGDWGQWDTALSTPRSWIGACSSGSVPCVGSTNAKYLHISGYSNQDFPIHTSAGTNERVVGLFDSVIMPYGRAKLHVGTNGLPLPRSPLIIETTDPNAEWTGELRHKARQSALRIIGEGDASGSPDPTFSGLYLASSDASSEWVLAHKITANRFALSHRLGAGSATEHFTVINNGGQYRAGINISSPQSTLHVAGTAQFDGQTTVGGNLNVTGTVFAASDRSLKENIHVLADGSLEKLLKIAPVRFQWKKTNTPPDQAGETEIGFIAQDVEKELPQAVKQTKEGLRFISYMGLLSHVIKSIQEMWQQATESQNRISLLEARYERQDLLLKSIENENAILKKQIEDLAAFVKVRTSDKDYSNEQ